MVHVPLVYLSIAFSHRWLTNFREQLCLALQTVQHLPHNLLHVIKLTRMLGEELLNAYFQLLQVVNRRSRLLDQAQKAQSRFWRR